MKIESSFSPTQLVENVLSPQTKVVTQIVQNIALSTIFRASFAAKAR
jgi:hypothetical protein